MFAPFIDFRFYRFQLLNRPGLAHQASTFLLFGGIQFHVPPNRVDQKLGQHQPLKGDGFQMGYKLLGRISHL
jgi:hypothetical protein